MILSDRSKMVHIHQKPCSLFKVGAHIQHELFQGTDRPTACILDSFTYQLTCCSSPHMGKPNRERGCCKIWIGSTMKNTLPSHQA